MSLIGLHCNEISLSSFCTVVSIPVFYIFHFYGSILVTDTTVQNNDEISLHFKPTRQIFMNYSV